MGYYDKPEPPPLPDCPECGCDSVTCTGGSWDESEMSCECGFAWSEPTKEGLESIRADYLYDLYRESDQARIDLVTQAADILRKSDKEKQG